MAYDLPIKIRRNAALILAAIAIVAAGCRFGSQEPELPTYQGMTDDIQYFPAGTEFKLPPEAAALKAARREERLKAERESPSNISPSSSSGRQNGG